MRERERERERARERERGRGESVCEFIHMVVGQLHLFDSLFVARESLPCNILNDQLWCRRI